MIKKTAEIKEISYSLYGEPLVKDIQEQPERGTFYKKKIPFQFKYNSSWKVGHTCHKCQNQILFGEESDSNGHVHRNGFDILKYVCSKYYDKKFLKVFPKVFTATELKQVNEKFYVISDGIFENDYPVTSSITPLFYTCPNCQAEYLVRFRQGFPYAPDAGMPAGMPGTVFIDEIVQIKDETGKRFSDFVLEER